MSPLISALDQGAHAPRSPRAGTPARRGAVLVEFAVIALVLILLLAAILDYGRALHDAQVLQQAADVLALELSRTPLPATGTFDEALQDPQVLGTLFDGQYLDVRLGADQRIEDYFADKPVVNRLLAPLMELVPEEGDTKHLRYPGVVRDADGVYKVPAAPPAGGSPTLVPVIEEVRTDPADPATGPFALTSTLPLPQRGFVALRLNFGFQGQALQSFRYQAPDGTFYDHIPVGETGFLNVPTGQRFYRLLSAQAVYRRELFAN